MRRSSGPASTSATGRRRRSAAAWLEVYRDADRWFELYQLAEKLVDIDDALAGWRHKHVLTVERIIGNKPGTGGSAGAPYLRSTLEKRAFPELGPLRTVALSFKPLFARSLGADPERLHFAAHSHHLWPDASFEGQVECWEDAARLADRKWDRIMGEVWPEAQGHVADELGTAMPDAVVFAPNTHELLVRLFAAASLQLADPRADQRRRVSQRPAPVRALGGSRRGGRRARSRRTVRQLFRPLSRSGASRVITTSFSSARCCSAAAAGSIWSTSWPRLPGPKGRGSSSTAITRSWRSRRRSTTWPRASAFYLGGGYKYAMSGEGCAFLHAPPGFGERPRITGWFAEFEDLTLPPGSVGYRKDAMRFMGATFDPSGLYRFNAVRRMLWENGLTTARISAHVARLQERLLRRQSKARRSATPSG